MMLLFAAGTEWRLHNHPGPLGSYRAQMLTLLPEWLQAFHRSQPQCAGTPEVLGLACIALQGHLKAAWQGLQEPALAEASPALVAHKVVELLLVLAEAGHSFSSEHSVSLQNQIHALVLQAPEKSWPSADLAQQFHMSESTLLRHLKKEGTSPSHCIRQARLEHGLMLLQTTRQPIGRIAQACGYASHSRFSTAFELCFGLRPLQLRQHNNSINALRPA
jgi:AraC-like DNA-binding protein